MAQIKLKLWVSTLIPREGKDCYDGGVRVAVHMSDLEAFNDLAEWLESEGEDGGAIIDDGPDDKELRMAAISTALDESTEVEDWNIESQTLFLDSKAELEALLS